MPTIDVTSPLDAPAEVVYDWHARPGAFERLTPPWAPVRLESFEGIEDGDRAVLRIGLGSLSLRWVAEHYDGIEGRQFCDRQVQGPFPHWEHTHRFYEDDGETLLSDRIEYELPFGEIGEFVAEFGDLGFEPMFRARHRRTKQLLEG